MRVSARFNDQGLALELYAETEPEKKMIGAVLNQPFVDPNYGRCEIDSALLVAIVNYEGHWSHKSVAGLTLRLHRQESPSSDAAVDQGEK